MDLDGDGFLSMYELEFFYDEQLQRMEAMGIECLPFEDCLCQVRVTGVCRRYSIFSRFLGRILWLFFQIKTVHRV